MLGNLWIRTVDKALVIHNFRMKAIYIFTISESELYIFPQHPNGNYIFFHSFRMKAICDYYMFHQINFEIQYIVAKSLFRLYFRMKATYFP